MFSIKFFIWNWRACLRKTCNIKYKIWQKLPNAKLLLIKTNGMYHWDCQYLKNYSSEQLLVYYILLDSWQYPNILLLHFILIFIYKIPFGCKVSFLDWSPDCLYYVYDLYCVMETDLGWYCQLPSYEWNFLVYFGQLWVDL